MLQFGFVFAFKVLSGVL